MDKFKLIKGKFSQDEAKEILTNIFSEKINFHLMKNYSSQERFGKDDENATQRIQQLRQELKLLQETLSDEKWANKKLIISSEIKISTSKK